jgi:hypothetical protein
LAELGRVYERVAGWFRRSAQPITGTPEEGTCWYPHDVRVVLSRQPLMGDADSRRVSPWPGMPTSYGDKLQLPRRPLC